MPDHGDTGSVVDVGATEIALVPSPSVDPELLKKAEPPACEFEGATKPPPGSGRPGATADPNLLKIAQLQLVSDCYNAAERAVSERLERLQRAQFKPATVDREFLKKAEPPACKFKSLTMPPPGFGWPGANADPNLLKIAQLQLVSECYKSAERAARERLERLQSAFVAGL